MLAHGERKLIGIGGHHLGGVDRAAVGHDKHQVEHLEGVDEAQDQHRLDGGAQQQQGDAGEAGPAARPVDGGALVQFGGDGGKPGGKQNHVEGNADPHIGHHQRQHGGNRGGEPVDVAADQAEAFQNVVEDAHVGAEDVFEHQRRDRDRDHPGHHQQAPDRLGKGKVAGEEQRQQKSYSKLQHQTQHGIQQGVADGAAENAVGKQVSVVGQCHKLALAVDQVFLGHVLQAQDHVVQHGPAHKDQHIQKARQDEQVSCPLVAEQAPEGFHDTSPPEKRRPRICRGLRSVNQPGTESMVACASAAASAGAAVSVITWLKASEMASEMEGQLSCGPRALA